MYPTVQIEYASTSAIECLNYTEIDNVCNRYC